jgi:hypothetical protein
MLEIKFYLYPGGAHGVRQISIYKWLKYNYSFPLMLKLSSMTPFTFDFFIITILSNKTHMFHVKKPGHQYFIQHSLKSGSTKDHFRRVKVPVTAHIERPGLLTSNMHDTFWNYLIKYTLSQKIGHQII